MGPVIVETGIYYKGDTWDGFNVGPVLINEEQPSSYLVAVRMQFRDRKGNVGFEFNSKITPEDGKGIFEINNPITWEFTTLPIVMSLDKGVWFWDLETTDSSDKVITLYRGALTVMEDITNG